MKAQITTLALCAMTLAACNHDKDDVAQLANSGEIIIDANVGQMSEKKALKLGTRFDAGDEISVYAWTGTADEVPAELQVNNSINTLGSDGKWTAEPKMLWKDGKSKHYFLGVYPQKQITDFATDEYALNIANQEASDLLIATNLQGLDYRSSAIPLKFTHVMARLDVNVKVANFSEEPTEAKIRVKAKTAATINYANKKVTAIGEDSEIILPAAANTADGYLFSYSSIMIPQDGLEGIDIVIGDRTFVYTRSKNITLKSGYYTTLNLTVRCNEITVGDVEIIDWNTGEVIEGDAIEDESKVLSCGGTIADAVDMGLSVKWASWNVGASSPEQSGNYYAWGETETKEVYNWGSYEHMQSGKSSWEYVNKYQTDDGQLQGSWYKNVTFVGDGKTTLDVADNAAAANWGGDWVMPTNEDWQELQSYCTLTWTTQNGMNGYLVTSNKNDNSIFVPAAGYRLDSDLNSAGSCGYYWSSSLYEGHSYDARHVGFDSDHFGAGYNGRDYGFSVRAVCPASGFTNGHAGVDLGLPSGKLWATCNVGASAPEASGVYFAWGEIEAKEYYDWSTYKHMQSGESDWKYINKYQVADLTYGSIWYTYDFVGDNKTTLEATDDAATANWGGKWRMPTYEEWVELDNNTTKEWTNDYNGTGVAGYIFTSTVTGHTDASIFLPAAGARDGIYLSGAGSYGYFWPSSLGEFNSDNARLVYFNSGGFSTNYSDRDNGFSVRAVCPAE